MCKYCNLCTPAKHVHEIDCQVLMVPTVTCVLHKMYPFSLFMLHQSVTIYFVFYCIKNKLTNLVVAIKTKTHGHGIWNLLYNYNCNCPFQMMLASLIAKYSLESSLKDCSKKCSPSHSPERPKQHFRSWRYSPFQSRYWKSKLKRRRKPSSYLSK